jgi:hypothetical protein
MFDIEQGIPVPEVRRGRPPKYQFRDMEVGDSFFIPCFRHEQKRRVNLALSAGFNILGRGAIKATCVKEGHQYGVRVHRVA